MVPLNFTLNISKISCYIVRQNKFLRIAFLRKYDRNIYIIQNIIDFIFPHIKYFIIKILNYNN